MKTKKGFTYLKCGMLIIGVIIIPMLYSYFYLDAFWDPYNRLDTLPVALVNEDQGAVINSESRNLGNEMVKELKDDGSLKWIETSEKDADTGVESGKYYAAVTIPSSFSSNISSAETVNKVKGQLSYKCNQKKNYVASQILSKAMLTVENKIDSKITESITSQLTAKLNEVPDKLQEVKDGFGQISDGAKKLEDGSATLYSGSKTVASNLGTLDSGLGTLKSGSALLSSNLTTMDSKVGDLLTGAKQLDAGASAIPTLNAGITSLDSGAQQLNAQMSHSTGGTPTLYDSVYALNTGTKQYVGTVNSTVEALRNDPTISSAIVTTLSGKLTAAMTYTPNDTATITQLKTLIALFTPNSSDPQVLAVQQGFTGSGSQLSEGTTQLLEQFDNGSAANPTLKYAVSGIAAGTSQLAANKANLTAMQTGVSQLEQAVEQLKDGTSQLAAGAAKIQTGVSSAKDGSSKLKDGAYQLADGAKQLKDGSQQIGDGATTAQNEVTDKINDTNEQLKSTKGLDTYAGSPVSVNEKEIYPVPNYGTSFAPYFLSLSLYVGALMMFFGIYLDPDEKIKILSRNSDKKILRVGAFSLIGIAQAVILATILKYILGLKVTNIFGFYFCAILVSIVFISIVELLLVHFKDVGKFIAIAFLVLQLTSCAGVFPMETVPKFFNYLYPYMPMTYSVRVFKDVISGYSGTDLYKNVWVLIGIFAIFTGLTILLSLTRKATVKIKAKVEANANA